MKIRVAGSNEFDAVRGFYHSLIDEMQDSPYLPGWEKDIYPDNEYLRAVIDRGELYVGELGDEIAAAMVLNHDCNESYASAVWPTQAMREEITMIHILGVHPRFAGRGLAKELVDWAIAQGGKEGQRAIRLDVLKGNLPAERLYQSKGFRYVDTIQMFYEDTGWMEFKLYEYPLV